jgi:Tol biopolymer transport system component
MVVLAALAAFAVVPERAGATFRGADGRVAWSYNIAPDEDEGVTDYGLVTVGGGHRQHTVDYCSDQGDGSYCPEWSDVAFSPNGKQLLEVIITEQGRDEIVKANATGSGLQPIIDHPGENDVQPSFSPDGARIVYVRTLDGNGQHAEIVTSNLVGGDVRVIESKLAGHSPVWSPNGQTILFVHHTTIWSIGANGRDAKPIIPDGEAPDFSPNGDEIAYVGVKSGAIYLADARGGDRREVHITGICSPPACEGFVEALVFSPDGSQLAFADNDASADPVLDTVPVTGGSASQIDDIFSDDGGGNTTGLSWQP